ncbi:FACT complex subunit SPT16-like [Typha angustifolia]|uniref:FACT complex subunit SPT16-like n=1 Tax=Typha angustifolia TaxID=59011 RepID=UPI003C3048A6
MADRLNVDTKPVPGGESSGYTIDLENLSKRLKEFYNHWSKHKSDLWGLSDAIAIASPPTSEHFQYRISSAFNFWLLGYEFSETIMVFMDKQIHFLCSQKKANLLETLKGSAKEAVGTDLVIHVTAKSDDGSALMEEIIHLVRAQTESDSPVVGYIAKEVPEGKLLETWFEKLAESALEIGDVTNGLSDLFAVKDVTELTCVKKAAFLSSCVMKNFVVPKLEKIIDEEKRISHSELMDDAEKAILVPTKVKVKLKAEDVGLCYPPILQSGGKFDLRPCALSNDDDLYYGPTSVIICAIGSRYKSYCSNIARTFLIDATPAQIKAYDVLLKAHDSAIAALKPGRNVSEAYQAAVAVVENESPELLPNLTTSAGAGIGLEFCESWLALNANNDRTIKTGMVFNVSLGFQNLRAETNNEKTEKFSLLLADTVIVTEELPAVSTAICSKAIKVVAFSSDKKEEEEHPRPRSEANRT